MSRGRALRIRLGLGVPNDGVMHRTWAFRALDAVGLATVAHALGIGCVSDRQLRRWDRGREQAARHAALDAIHALREVDRAAAAAVAERHRAVVG